MNKKGNYFIGAVLILIGVLLLAGKLDILNIGFIIENFWATIFIILPGLIFHYAFFRAGRKSPGLLVPGGILVFTGLTLQISYTLNAWDVLWPGFIMAVALALFELYYYGNRDGGILIPVGILGGLSIIFFLSFSVNRLFDYNIRRIVVPVIFILIGLFIIFGKNRGKNSENADEIKTE